MLRERTVVASRCVKVVAGHVDGLDGGDRAGLGGGDALLQVAHLGGERRLVAHRRRHAPEQRGDLGAGLGEAEDVVDEQQDVLAAVAEVLGLREARQADAQARSGRLVHLAVDQAGLVDDARLAHLEVQVGALAGALAHAGEDGGAAVLLGEVVDELLDEHRLADAGAAEQTGLAAADIGLEEVDRLDAGLEDLGLGGQLVEARRGMVDGIMILHLGHGLAVHGLAHDVPDAAEGLVAHGHLHGAAGVDGLDAALQAVRGGHRHAADDAAGQLALHLEDGLDAAHGRLGVDGQGVVDARDPLLELDVDDRADDADDASDAGGRLGRGNDGLCH